MLSVRTRGLNEAVQRLSNFDSSKIQRAVRSAIMRTLRGAKRDAGTKIASRYTIAPTRVTKTIKVKASGFSGSMTSSGGVHSVAHFLMRPKRRPKKMPKGGVFVSNVRGSGGNLPRAFVIGSHAFERVGKSRFPIEKKFGPSSPGMLSSPPVSSFLVSKMRERLGINLEHELGALAFF